MTLWNFMVQNYSFSKAIWGSAFCTVFLGVVLVLLADVREASAQIPSNGVFYACVRLDKDGDDAKLVRLVAADEPCKGRETRVHWSVTGPQGPQGAPGPIGPAGARGANGAPGATGPQGAAGPQGPAGAQGVAGPQGVPGAQGPSGPAGTQGAAGATGEAGLPGERGAEGPQGISVALEQVAVGVADCSGTGGVKLTLVDGHGVVVSDKPEFACNGAPGAQGIQGVTGAAGPSGTAGQSAATFLTTAANTSSTAACAGVSGFPQSVTVPANAEVILSWDGAVQTTSALTTGASIVDYFLLVDGSTVATRRLYSVNSAVTVMPVVPFGLTRRLALAPGSHAINACALIAGGSPANISGAAGSPLQMGVTVAILNK